jgi:hypothetical protein
MSILLYACETWTLRQEQLQRLEVFHNRCIRRLKGVTMLDRVSNASLHAKEPATHPISAWIAKHRLRWIGHLARREDTYLPKQMLFAHFTHPRPRHLPAGGRTKSYLDYTNGLLTSHDFVQQLRGAEERLRAERPEEGQSLPRAGLSWYAAAQNRGIWSDVSGAMVCRI